MSKLNNAIIKNLNANEKAYKVSDGNGLYLYVSTTGTKSFRIDYTINKKRKTYTIGTYPEIPLIEARLKAAEIKIELKKGIAPMSEKQMLEQGRLVAEGRAFDSVVTKWIEIKQFERTEKHKKDILSKLERFIYPTFKDRDINSITAKEMLDVVRKIEAKKLYETCKKTLGICNQVFSFAIGEGLVEHNICAGLTGQLISVRAVNYAHITDKKEFAELLKKIDLYPHGELIKLALQIAPLVFVRPSELAKAKWSEIDFDEALWTIPADRMKTNKTHLVPLSSQTHKLLQELHMITGETEYLFANWNRKNKPLSTDGIRQGLRRLGYKDLTTHGFRHTASTMLNELGYNSDWIEKQLAHTGDNSVRATYNHAQYLPDRRRMMQEWADYLDNLKEKY